MIDFRYHLVSLISVFLALAVGVVLGAGPLQGPEDRALNDQVTSLLRTGRPCRPSSSRPRRPSTTATHVHHRCNGRLHLPGPSTAGRSPWRSSPTPRATTSITAQVETAGGTINGRVSLTTAWTDDSREAFRQTYSGQFAGYLGKTVSTDGNGVLGEGLGTALTSDSESAKALMGLLTASGHPLVTVACARPNSPADMIVAVGPRSADASETRADAEASATMSQTATS